MSSAELTKMVAMSERPMTETEGSICEQRVVRLRRRKLMVSRVGERGFIWMLRAANANSLGCVTSGSETLPFTKLPSVPNYGDHRSSTLDVGRDFDLKSHPPGRTSGTREGSFFLKRLQPTPGGMCKLLVVHTTIGTPDPKSTRVRPQYALRSLKYETHNKLSTRRLFVRSIFATHPACGILRFYKVGWKWGEFVHPRGERPEKWYPEGKFKYPGEHFVFLPKRNPPGGNSNINGTRPRT